MRVGRAVVGGQHGRRSHLGGVRVVMGILLRAGTRLRMSRVWRVDIAVAGGHDNVGELICDGDDPLSLGLVAREEFQQVLELARALLLEEALGAAGFAWVPTELGSSAVDGCVLFVDHVLPGGVNQRLVKKAIDDAGVHPVILAEARLEMAGDVLDMALAGRVEGGAEATGPVFAFSEKLDHLFGVGASLASMALLVVLIKGIGAPEAAVAAGFGAGVLSPALVKLVFVSLPVVLALKAGFTGCTPVDVLFVAGGGRDL